MDGSVNGSNPLASIPAPQGWVLNHEDLPRYFPWEKGFLMREATSKYKNAEHKQWLGCSCWVHDEVLTLHRSQIVLWLSFPGTLYVRALADVLQEKKAVESMCLKTSPSHPRLVQERNTCVE